jgi:Skp family chaperone for outer membrane proteins
MFGLFGRFGTVGTLLLVATAPAFAQARGQAPVPAPAAAAQPPAAAQPAPAPPPPAPFPVGAKIGFVNLQRVAQMTADGKAAAVRVQKLAQDKQTEAANRAKALQANQQKLQASGGVMSDAARAQLEKDVATEQRDNDRFEQDAQAEINELQQQVQKDFQNKLFPILEELQKEKGLWAMFSAADAGVISWDPGLDFTDEAVKRMDAAAAKK